MTKILAIDDKPDNLTTLSAILKKYIPDCTVITAQSGYEGIEKAITELPDTILMDVKMPGMDGYEACKKIKANEATRHIPIAMITAIRTESVDISRGLDIGVEAFLAKPIDETVLVAQVNTLLRIKKTEDKLRSQKDLLEKMVRERTDALRKSEKNYKVLLETTSEGFWQFNPELKTVEVNPALCKMLGYSAEEMIGKTPFDFADDENQKIFSEQTAKISTTLNRSYEIVLRKKNQETFLAHFNGTTIHDESGKVKSVFAFVTDITELKQTEYSLRESEIKYRQIFENIQDVYYETSLEGQIIEISPSIKNMSQYTRKELLGRSLYDIYVSPKERDRLVQTLIKKHIVTDYEITVKDKDGSLRNCSLMARLIKDDMGYPTKVIGALHDITERVEAEKKMNRQRYYLEKAQELGQIGSWELDLRANKFYWTDETCRIFGVEAGSVVNYKIFLEKVHPDDRKYVDLESKAAIKGKPYDIEHRLIVDGTIKWVREKAIVTFDEGGTAINAIGFTQDITDRRQAELEKKNREQLLNEMGAIAKIGGWEHDLVSNKASWTKETYNIIEIESDPVPGPDEHLDYYPPKDRAVLEDAYRRAEETGEQFDLKLQCNTAKGRRLWARVVGRPEFKDGKCVKIKGTFQDITEQKKLEEQFRQAQKMESVGRLAGGVAHDYNNALSVIIGFTELALDEVGTTGLLGDNLKEVLSAANRATEITRQLLAFARKQTIAPKVLDLNENVESMLKMLRHLIGEDIELAWLPGAGLRPVKVDPSQVDQIMVNLCVNARDAINGVGRVTIETGPVVFDSDYCADHAGSVPGEFVMLSVSDNGCGIDKDILENIFEPFFTTKDVDKGTGLGLATVYGIVKQNDGFIDVYSELEKGTSVKIYLPRHEVAAVEILDESMEELPQGQGETVLIVEDDLSILKLAQKILEGLGYTVLTAGTPLASIRLVEAYSEDIHLLVTDVIMPQMNGRAMAQQLKSIYPDLKCMFMSGYTADVISRHGVLDEGMQFIQKPFSKRALATIVRKILDGRE